MARIQPSERSSLQQHDRKSAVTTVQPVGRNLIEALPKCTVGEAPALQMCTRGRYTSTSFEQNGQQCGKASTVEMAAERAPGQVRVDASPKWGGCLSSTCLNIQRIKRQKTQKGHAEAAAAGDVPQIPRQDSCGERPATRGSSTMSSRPSAPCGRNT